MSVSCGSRANLKQQAHALIDGLPDTAMWDDVVYGLVVRREIEKGLTESAAGRVIPTEEVIKRFNLPK
jgi:predicted transcriptional regulator